MKQGILAVLALLTTSLAIDCGDKWTTAKWRSFMVSIGLVSLSDDGVVRPAHKCAASVISDKYPLMLLTAAHCVRYNSIDYTWSVNSPADYFVFFEVNRLGDKDFKMAPIIDVFYPKAYENVHKGRIYGDIAVIAVDVDMSKISTISIDATIFDPGSNFHRFKGYPEVKLVGYGSHGEDSVSNEEEEASLNRLQDTKSYLLQKDTCRDVLGTYFELVSQGRESELVNAQKGFKSRGQLSPEKRAKNKADYGFENPTAIFKQFRDSWHELDEVKAYVVYDDEICAWDFDNYCSSACQGDSGGPMIYMGAKSDITKRRVMGVTSGALTGGCKTFLPVVYSSVEFYKDWIEGAMACLKLSTQNRIKKGELTNESMERVLDFADEEKQSELYKQLEKWVSGNQARKDFGKKKLDVKAKCAVARQLEEEWANEKMERTNDICQTDPAKCGMIHKVKKQKRKKNKAKKKGHKD